MRPCLYTCLPLLLASTWAHPALLPLPGKEHLEAGLPPPAKPLPLVMQEHLNKSFLSLYKASPKPLSLYKALVQAGLDLNVPFKKDGTSTTVLIQSLFYRQLVAWLLNHGADPNQAEEGGDPPLLFLLNLCPTCVVSSYRMETFRLLIKAGAQVNACGKEQTTPLMRAAFQGQLEVVKLLLTHGAQVNKPDSQGYTALIWATQYPYSPDSFSFFASRVESSLELLKAQATIIALLAAQGADLALTDQQGQTAMMHSLLRGRKKADSSCLPFNPLLTDQLRLLGAPLWPSTTWSHQAAKLWSHFYTQLREDQQAKAYLLGYLTHVERTYCPQKKLLFTFLQQLASATSAPYLAHQARRTAHAPRLATGPSPAHKQAPPLPSSSAPLPRLIHAQINATLLSLLDKGEEGYHQAERLIQAGLDLNIPFVLQDGRPSSLLLAAYSCPGKHLEWLIAHGANPNQQVSGQPPFLLSVLNTIYLPARTSYRLSIMRTALQEGGADPNLATKQGKTLLMEAAFRGYTQEVKLLLDHGALVNLQDHQGYTALIWALQPCRPASSYFMARKNAAYYLKNNIQVIHLLCAHRADLAQTDHAGRTAMMHSLMRYNRFCPTVALPFTPHPADALYTQGAPLFSSPTWDAPTRELAEHLCQKAHNDKKMKAYLLHHLQEGQRPPCQLERLTKAFLKREERQMAAQGNRLPTPCQALISAYISAGFCPYARQLLACMATQAPKHHWPILAFLSRG